MFTQGERYRVWYRIPPQRKHRSFVGTFLGEDFSGRCEFNLRPAASTAWLSPENVEAYRPTQAEHSQPVIVFDIPSLVEDETTGYQAGPALA